MNTRSIESQNRRNSIHFEGNGLSKLTEKQKEALRKYLDNQDKQKKEKERSIAMHITNSELAKLQSILDSNNQEALSQFLEVQDQEYIETHEILAGTESAEAIGEEKLSRIDTFSYKMLFGIEGVANSIQLNEDAKRNFSTAFTFFVLKIGKDAFTNIKENGKIDLSKNIDSGKIKTILSALKKYQGSGESNSIFMNPKEGLDFLEYAYNGKSEEEISSYLMQKETNNINLHKITTEQKGELQKIGVDFANITKENSPQKIVANLKENNIDVTEDNFKNSFIFPIIAAIYKFFTGKDLFTEAERTEFNNYKKVISANLIAKGSMFAGKQIPNNFMTVKGSEDNDFLGNIQSAIGERKDGFGTRFLDLVKKGGTFDTFMQDTEIKSLTGSLLKGEAISNKNLKEAFRLYAIFEAEQSKNPNYTIASFVESQLRGETTEDTTETNNTNTPAVDNQIPNTNTTAPEPNTTDTGTTDTNDDVVDNLDGEGLPSNTQTTEESYVENNPNAKKNTNTEDTPNQENNEDNTENNKPKPIEIPVLTTQLTESFFIDTNNYSKIQETNKELAKYGLEGGLVRLLMGYDNYIKQNLSGFSNDIANKIRTSIGIRTSKLNESINEVAKEISENKEEGKEVNYRWVVNARIKKQFEEVNNKILPSALLLHKYNQATNKDEFRKTSMKNVETDGKNDFFDTRIEEIKEMFAAELDKDDGQFDEWGAETVNQRNTLQIDEDTDLELFQEIGGDTSELNINILNEEDQALEKKIMIWYLAAISAQLAIETVGGIAGIVAGGVADAYDAISNRDVYIQILQKMGVIPEEYRREKTNLDRMLAGLSILPFLSYIRGGRKMKKVADSMGLSMKEVKAAKTQVIEFLKKEKEIIKNKKSITKLEKKADKLPDGAKKTELNQKITDLKGKNKSLQDDIDNIKTGISGSSPSATAGSRNTNRSSNQTNTPSSASNAPNVYMNGVSMPKSLAEVTSKLTGKSKDFVVELWKLSKTGDTLKLALKGAKNGAILGGVGGGVLAGSGSALKDNEWDTIAVDFVKGVAMGIAGGAVGGAAVGGIAGVGFYGPQGVYNIIKWSASGGLKIVRGVKNTHWAVKSAVYLGAAVGVGSILYHKALKPSYELNQQEKQNN